MKKLLLLLAVSAALAPGARAGNTWTLQNKTYNVDTLYHAKIGPGTTQTSLALSGAQTLKVYYTTTDLTDPWVDIRVTKASNKVVGCTTLSKMCSSNSREGAQYFAGVNADFFGNSAPIGSTVVDGEVYLGLNNTWVNWYMSDGKKPGIQTLGFRGTATNPAGATCTVTGVNSGRDTDNLVIYNVRKGANTGTNAYGAEVRIVPVDGALTFNGTMKAKVQGAVATAGSMSLSAGSYVLSGHGVGAAFVNTLKDGDIVTVEMNNTLATGGDVAQMASGQPAILSGGKTLDTQYALDHLTALNPRTAVGYNADGTKLVLLVVDGRRSGVSVGVVSKVLADIMREVGCTEAMNFDGGGSSELYTQAFGVRNQPSDGQERSVTNAVWTVATSPTDNTVAAISFVNPTMTLPKYGFFEPQIYGYNKYGVLIDTNLKGVTLSCDAALGEVVNDGHTLFANGDGTHALTAHYGEATATIPVTIGAGQPKMRLSKVVVDGHRTYKAEVTATIDGLEMAIDNAALTWSSADSHIATVNETGEIAGVNEGTTVITGTVSDFEGQLPVTVEIPAVRYEPIDATADASTWTTSKVGVKNDVLSALPDGVLKADFTVSSTRGTSLTLKKDLYTSALPDSLRLVINPGDAVVNKVTLSAAAADDRAVKSEYTTPLTPGVDNVVEFAVNDFSPRDDFRTYPLHVSSLAFSLGGKTNTKYTIELKRFDQVYTHIKATEGVGSVTGDADLAVAVSPNPVERGTDVVIAGADSNTVYTVYSLDGKAVVRGHGDTIATGAMHSGVYVVSVTSATAMKTAKLVVK